MTFNSLLHLNISYLGDSANIQEGDIMKKFGGLKRYLSIINQMIICIHH